MTVKTAAGVAVAAACLMSFVAIPGAKSQPAPGYYGSQTYPGNAPTGSYGSTTGNYAPQAQDNASPNPALGTSGSAMGNNVPPNYQGTSSPNWSEGSNGSMTGSYDSQPPAANLVPDRKRDRSDLVFSGRLHIGHGHDSAMVLVVLGAQRFTGCGRDTRGPFASRGLGHH